MWRELQRFEASASRCTRAKFSFNYVKEFMLENQKEKTLPELKSAEFRRSMTHAYMYAVLEMLVDFTMFVSESGDEIDVIGMKNKVVGDNPFSLFKEDSIVSKEIAKEFVPYIMDELASKILLSKLFSSSGISKMTADKDINTNPHPLFVYINNSKQSTEYGRPFRIYMDFVNAAKFLVAAGLKNHAIINSMRVNYWINQKNQNMRRTLMSQVKGFNSFHRAMFESKLTNLTKGASPDAFIAPFSELSKDEVQLVTGVLMENGQFRSIGRQEIIVKLLNAMVSESGKDGELSTSPLDDIQCWQEFVKQANQSPTFKLNEFDKIKAMISLATEQIKTSENFGPYYANSSLMDHMAYFLQNDAPRLSLEQVKITVFHLISFHFFVLDLSHVVHECVNKIHPELYKDGWKQRIKYIDFFKYCLENAQLQTCGKKRGRIMYSSLESLMHEELGQRYALYLLCSQKFNIMAQQSQIPSPDPHLFSGLQRGLNCIVNLDTTRPMITRIKDNFDIMKSITAFGREIASLATEESEITLPELQARFYSVLTTDVTGSSSVSKDSQVQNIAPAPNVNKHQIQNSNTNSSLKRKHSDDINSSDVNSKLSKHENHRSNFVRLFGKNIAIETSKNIRRD